MQFEIDFFVRQQSMSVKEEPIESPTRLNIDYKELLKVNCRKFFRASASIITHYYLQPIDVVTSMNNQHIVLMSDGTLSMLLYHSRVILPDGKQYESEVDFSTIHDTENYLCHAIMQRDARLAFDKENAYFFQSDGFSDCGIQQHHHRYRRYHEQLQIRRTITQSQ